VPKFHLVLLIHAHQPVGNFEGVFEQTYQRSYLPFVEALMRHPGIHLGLHYSGALLEWCEQKHPEYVDTLRMLAARGQVELVGGGFYEPILISIPREDQLEQLRRMHEHLLRTFGAAPTGAWLAERVWEPQLPHVLAAAGVRYTLVDDVHFVSAGFELSQLHGDYLTEDTGHTVRVFPGLKALRYLLPFGTPAETISFLRDSANKHPGGLASMGDDLEKFGAWPETYKHCYVDGWVDQFFAALESSSDWLATTTPGAYIASHTPLGRADLPAASYTEMMEWALPTRARSEFHELAREFAERPLLLRFLRGGHWRGFLTKYPEANLLHKKMLHVSRKLRALAGHQHGEPDPRLSTARTHLLRAQCNDAYWHGVFGGLYAPHLRTEPWRSLVRAETLEHEVASADDNSVHVQQFDFDADGADECYATSRRLAALIKPDDGGTIASLDFRSTGVTLINSLARRPEAYHARLREAATAPAAAAGRVLSIHDQVRSKEPGLERFLQYDRWQRNAFRVLLFSAAKTFDDYRLLRLDEHAGVAGGNYEIREALATGVKLVYEPPAAAASQASGHAQVIGCTKNFTFEHLDGGYQVTCEVELVCDTRDVVRESQTMRLGIEAVVNLLAPDADDRYFDVPSGRRPLRLAAAIAAPDLHKGSEHASLRMVDEWQDVAVTLEASAPTHFWISPIETVSESEEGFERVYQGSQIMALWPVELRSGNVWRGRMTLSAHRARTV
jgi:alpha-amylase